MNRSFFCWTMAIFLTTAIAAVNHADAQEHAGAGGEPLRKLLTERRDILQQRLDLVQNRFREGGTPGETTSLKNVASATDALLLAELELASSRPERIALLKKRIDNFRSVEQFVTALYEGGRDSLDEKLLATANRLQAEIDLVREQAKGN